MESWSSFTRNLIRATVLMVATALALVPLPLGVSELVKLRNFGENRRLAAAPVVSLASSDPAAFLRQVDAYVGDNFAFRELAIVANAYLRYLFSSSIRQNVVIGRNGFLFRADGPYDTDDYRGRASMPSAMVENWRDGNLKRQAWLREQGIDYLFLVPAVAGNVYSQYLPRHLTPVSDRRRIDDLVDSLSAAGGNILFLRRALQIGARDVGQVFLKKDTHWNSLGAFVGAQETLRWLRQAHPTIRVPQLSDHIIVRGNAPPNTEDLGPNIGVSPWTRFDLSVRLGLPFFADPDLMPVPKAGWRARMRTEAFQRWRIRIYEQDAPELPTLLFIGDSYTQAIRPYMAESFRRAVFVNPWEHEPIDQFPVDLIQAERPDLVVWMRMEGAVGTTGLALNPPEVDAAASVLKTGNR